MRRFGEAVKAGQKYTLRAGVYAVLPRNGAMLVTHQSSPYSEIQLPGGGIDPGESPLQALHREVLEETGWRIAPLRRLGAFRRFTFMPDYDIWAEKMCHVYLAQPVRQLAAPTEPYHTALWMPAEQALANLGNDGDRHFAAACLGR